MFLRNVLKYKRYVLLLGIISLLYISVILFYTHGALMFDGNYAGFYHLVPSLFTTPNGILEGVSLLISQGNIYAAYYVYLYLSILSLLIASFYLSLQILSKFVPKDLLLISSAVAASLSFIEPFVLTDYYSSLLGNAWLGFLFPSSLFILFLAFLFRSYSAIDDKTKFLNSMLLSGSFLGISLTPFPNDIRIIVMGYFLFIATIIFIFLYSLSNGKSFTGRMVFLSVIMFIITSFVFSLFDTYPMLSINQLMRYYVAASTSVHMGGGSLGFYTGNFNTIPQVIRLLGSWSFPTGFIIYHNIYYRINVVNISSYFWPFLALFFPLFFGYKLKKNRGFFLFIMILVILSVFWEKGGNPPFGSIWYYVNSKVPFGYSFMPTGTIQSYILGPLYPVLATLSIVLMYSYIKNMRRLRKGLRKLVIFIPIALVIILVVAEMPVFDGQLEENYWAPKSDGFFIPSQYNYARDFLLSDSQDVLLFPGTGPWITTSWNYSGSSEFYYNFFLPLNVSNTYEFSGTSSLSPSVLEVHDLLNTPFINDTNLSSLSTIWLSELVDLNISYIIFDFTIIPSYVEFNYTYYLSAINLLLQGHLATLVLPLKNLKIYKINKSDILEIIKQ